jgi:hypothetical protein
MPAAFSRLIARSSVPLAASGDQPAWLVISPGITGTSVH